jgi:hypothetical protein
MKKFYTLFVALFVLMGIHTNAQNLKAGSDNLIGGGSMEKADELKWSISNLANDPTSTVTYKFGYTDFVPAAGSGGCLDVMFTNVGTNGTHIMFYQQVTLKKGKNYNFDLAIRALAPMDNSWFECYIGAPKPEEGSDYQNSNGSQLIGGFKWTGWETSCTETGDLFDGTLLLNGCIASAIPLIHYEGTGDTVLYIGFKMGIWAKATTIDLLIDNVSLKEVVPQSIDITHEQGLVVYPNPVTSDINVLSSTPVSRVVIYDIVGKEVLRVTNISNVIHAEQLKAGIYYMECRDAFNSKTITKFVKK